jgi:hypothetical protein
VAIIMVGVCEVRGVGLRGVIGIVDGGRWQVARSACLAPFDGVMDGKWFG